MTLSQILAILIFLAMFIAIIIGKQHRYVPALAGAVLTVVVVFLIVERSPAMVSNVFNLGQLVQYKFWVPGHEPLQSHGVNWQTIIFILGMMTMVEGLGASGFFRWLCLYVARLVNYRVVPLLIAFMVMSGFLAMFIDSITVLLFLATVTVELARLLKFDPVPVIVAEIFAANTGGAATMSGDPPNIIIGTAFGYTFTDFLVNTGPIAWAGMVLAMVFFFLLFRKTLSQTAASGVPGAPERYPQPGDAITSLQLFRLNSVVFIVVIALIVTHAQTGLSIGLVGVIAGLLSLAVAGTGAGHIVSRIDWRTLLFFIGLFVTVGGLEETGVLGELAKLIGAMAGSSTFVVLTIILWLSAVASAIVDNIPFAATMVPVIQGLSRTSGFDLKSMSWALSLGTDVGGNGTPIGASANVVGTAVAEREGYPISWGRYTRYCVLPTVLVLGLFWILVIVRYG